MTWHRILLDFEMMPFNGDIRQCLATLQTSLILDSVRLGLTLGLCKIFKLRFTHRLVHFFRCAAKVRLFALAALGRQSRSCSLLLCLRFRWHVLRLPFRERRMPSRMHREERCSNFHPQLSSSKYGQAAQGWYLAALRVCALEQSPASSASFARRN